jgi:hypothetical protein
MTEAARVEIRDLVAEAAFRLYGDAPTPVFKKEKTNHMSLPQGKSKLPIPSMDHICLETPEPSE